MANNQRLFFLLLIFSITSVVFAQGTPRSYHRFAWTEDPYALRYEVLIEKEEDGVYHNVLREFTDEPFIYFPLTPGIYRLRVIPFDFRNLPGAMTPWRYFRVFDRIDVLDPQMVVEDLPAPFFRQDEAAIQITPRQMHWDLYIALLGNVQGYTRRSAAFGGGLTFGGSLNNMGFSISLLYAEDTERFVFAEALASFRYYLMRARNNTGLFLQAEGGIVFFSRDSFEFSEHRTFTAGLCIGWRFPFGQRWYLEPVIRGGYPYLVGGGLSVGIRFF